METINDDNDNKTIEYKLDDGYGTETDDDEKIDFFVDTIRNSSMDKYIVLFHGDTFNLPQKCIITGQKIKLLATTNKYNTLFRVGKYSYGFQGHPELVYDMLKVWWYVFNNNNNICILYISI